MRRQYAPELLLQGQEQAVRAQHSTHLLKKPFQVWDLPQAIETEDAVESFAKERQGSRADAHTAKPMPCFVAQSYRAPQADVWIIEAVSSHHPMAVVGQRSRGPATPSVQVQNT